MQSINIVPLISSPNQLIRSVKQAIMDLLQLEHFLAIVDEGSFTRAAECVHRTQSAVSQSIKKLEETIGAPLFARDMPEICVTQTGKVLVEYARRLIRLREDAMRSF